MQDEELEKIPTAEDLEGQAAPDFLRSDHWWDVNVTPYRLDFTKPYTAPEYTLTWQDVGFAPLGGIHAITGQSGHGKTMTIAQFMAAILNGKCGNLAYNLGESHPKPRVLYIDTEMEESNTIAVKNRVLSMCDRDIQKNYDDFVVIMLREVPETIGEAYDPRTRQKTAERVSASVNRWRMVLRALYEYKPLVAFVDGLLDVVQDFNDNAQCQEIIYKCMQAASHYHISLWCVVHQNPGGEKLVGHLGSFLERKATDIFTTKKDKTQSDITFTVSQKKARGRDVPDWKYRVMAAGSWGLPEQLDTLTMNGADDPETIKKWIKQYRNEIEWPAYKNAIYDIFRMGGQKNKERLEMDFKIAENRTFLKKVSKQSGWKNDKYELNPELFNEAPTSPFTPQEENAPF